MKIKRIKKLRVNSYNFSVKWDKNSYSGSFAYPDLEIVIGVKSGDNGKIFDILVHELLEIAAVEMNVRLRRPDCDSDYIFVYDHRQHETISNMLASLIGQFIE